MGARINPARLDRELARRGWSATDLANASGCSPSTISGARRGRKVTHDTLRKICEALLNKEKVSEDLTGLVHRLLAGRAS